jgi:hypothetical protein
LHAPYRFSTPILRHNSGAFNVENLFGEEVEVINGRLIGNSAPFSAAETDQIVDEVIHGGELLAELAHNLKRLRKLIASETTQSINKTRRDAWEDLLWVYDLYGCPTHVPFDLACDVVGVDPEQIRGAISGEFAGEIRLMAKVILERLPDKQEHVQRRLSPYVQLSLH